MRQGLGCTAVALCVHVFEPARLKSPSPELQMSTWMGFPKALDIGLYLRGRNNPTLCAWARMKQCVLVFTQHLITLQKTTCAG